MQAFFCENDKLQDLLSEALYSFPVSLIGIVREFQSHCVIAFVCCCTAQIYTECYCAPVFGSSLVFHYHLCLDQLFGTDFTNVSLHNKCKAEVPITVPVSPHTSQWRPRDDQVFRVCRIGKCFYYIDLHTKKFLKRDMETRTTRSLAPNTNLLKTEGALLLGCALVGCDDGAVLFAFSGSWIATYTLKTNVWKEHECNLPRNPSLLVEHKNTYYVIYSDKIASFNFYQDEVVAFEYVWQSDNDKSKKPELKGRVRTYVKDGIIFCFTDNFIERFVLAEKKWQTPIQHEIPYATGRKCNFAVF